MFKKVIEYTNFNDEPRKMEATFSLKQTEIIDFDKKYAGGIQGELTRIATENSQTGLIALVQDLVLAAYGKKSVDGERFIKTPEQTQEFRESNAFDAFVIDICNDETGNKFMSFLTGILPKSMSTEATKLFTEKLKAIEPGTEENA